MFTTDSNLPLTKRCQLYSHMRVVMPNVTVYVRYMGWIWYIVFWTMIVYNWWYRNITPAVRSLSLSCTTPHMHRILAPAKRLQLCSNGFGGQVCNVTCVGMLLDVLYANGSKMSTRLLLAYCNPYRYQMTNLTTGPLTSSLACQKLTALTPWLFVWISLGNCVD